MFVIYNLAALEPGDIILSRHNGNVSRVVRRRTKSPWSHAMIYIDRTIVHTVGHGVPTINPQREWFEPHEVAVYRLPGMRPDKAAPKPQRRRRSRGRRQTPSSSASSTCFRSRRRWAPRVLSKS
jgi:hypothetical protein